MFSMTCAGFPAEIEDDTDERSMAYQVRLDRVASMLARHAGSVGGLKSLDDVRAAEASLCADWDRAQHELAQVIDGWDVDPDDFQATSLRHAHERVSELRAHLQAHMVHSRAYVPRAECVAAERQFRQEIQSQLQTIERERVRIANRDD
jgi:hypothetical protein